MSRQAMFTASVPDCTNQRRRRSGLAPLELVLWLPVLLIVAALMVNYGTLVCWQLRAQVVARDAAWRARWPRTGQQEPPPDAQFWPAGATMEQADASQLEQLDDPALRHPVAHGPLPNGFHVKPLFEPRQGAGRGLAEIERPYPLLPVLGPYRSGEVRHGLLDTHFQVAQMGLRSNQVRRIQALYRLPTTERHLVEAFAQALAELFAMQHFTALSVLDRDDQVRLYHGRYVDFHPQASSRIYGMDPESVRRSQVDRLVDTRDDDGHLVLGEISLLPRTITEFFLDMYYQANDPALQPKIDQLEAFHSRLVEMESEMGSG